MQLDSVARGHRSHPGRPELCRKTRAVYIKIIPKRKHQKRQLVLFLSIFTVLIGLLKF
jgi:hypothetical protein